MKIQVQKREANPSAPYDAKGDGSEALQTQFAPPKLLKKTMNQCYLHETISYISLFGFKEFRAKC